MMTDIDNASYADDSAPFILEKNLLVICLINIVDKFHVLVSMNNPVLKFETIHNRCH